MIPASLNSYSFIYSYKSVSFKEVLDFIMNARVRLITWKRKVNRCRDVYNKNRINATFVALMSKNNIKTDIRKTYFNELLHACRKIQPSLFVIMTSDLCREYRKTRIDGFRLKSLHCLPYHGNRHALKQGVT